MTTDVESLSGSNNSIIPIKQSGQTEFYIPLPIKGWKLPINVLCTLTSLTNAGIRQNAPVGIEVNFTLQNTAAIGAATDDYIYISSFDVETVNAIEVRYSPNWDSPTFRPWSFKPDNPARFSRLWCVNKDIMPNGTNREYEVFSGSGSYLARYGIT